MVRAAPARVNGVALARHAARPRLHSVSMTRHVLSPAAGARGLALTVGDWQLRISPEPGASPPAGPIAHELTHVLQQGGPSPAVARIWLLRARGRGPAAGAVPATAMDTITKRSGRGAPQSGVTVHGWNASEKLAVKGPAKGPWVPEVDDEVLVVFGSGDPRATHAALLAQPGALPASGAHTQVDLGPAPQATFRLRIAHRGVGPLSLAIATASDAGLTRDLRQRRLV